MKRFVVYLVFLILIFKSTLLAYSSNPKDFIQELVDIGIKVHCVIIESGWKEVDTVEDYKKALLGFNKKFTKS